MPLVNEQFWRDRFGQQSPCWSGIPWLDWEHEKTSKAAFRRVFPRGLVAGPPHSVDLEPKLWRVLDVGCGDGRWGAWMREELEVAVFGTDALEFPGVRNRIRFELVDAGELHEDQAVRRFKPEVVVFMNSLTCMTNWRDALRSAARVAAPFVLCFDNFQDPTPPWGRGLAHRTPIPLSELLLAAFEAGLLMEKAVAADYFHRKLFVHAPRWLYGPVAVVSLVLDTVAAHVLPPMKARHSAVLFRRRAGAGGVA